MNPKLQKRIQRYGWDLALPSYERTWEEQLKPAQELLMQLAAPREGERVLDVAAGTGLVTFRIAAAVGSSGHVLGTDISGEMVRSSAELAAGRGLAHVEFRRMEAEKLECDDASFDLVTCALGLMYVTDVPGCLAEMLRVLKPGGRAVVAVWGARRNCGWAEVFPIVDARVQSEVCPMFFNLGSGETLKGELARAGFADVTGEHLNSTLHYANAADACAAAFEGGPVALAWSKFPDDVKATARAEYLASIESYRSGDGYAVPGEFVVARGVK